MIRFPRKKVCGVEEFNNPQLPGRLGNKNLELRDDHRADGRMLGAMESRGLLVPATELPINAESSLQELLAFCAESEPVYEQLNEDAMSGLPSLVGVTTALEQIIGIDGNEIKLYIHRPKKMDRPLPCIVHLHGGGMVLMSAAGALYDRWRSELAVTGLVVIGVEFRNAAGALGPCPFPAGLHDCVSASYWAADNLAEINGAGIVISGESGGGNLALASCLKAKHDGRVGAIDGVYAQSPMISNRYLDKDLSLISLFENDGFGLDCQMMGTLSRVYDPTGANASNPLAWPLNANKKDLEGLPPHFISVCELDPLRDEGIAYTNKLRMAGVTASSRTINGITHVADMVYRSAMPDVYDASVADVKRFADYVCRSKKKNN